MTTARRRKTPAGNPDDDRRRIVAAALPRAALDGFSETVLKDAAAEARVAADDISRLFPDGPLSLVEAYSDLVDAEMSARLAEAGLPAMKIRERIACAMRTRLAILRPHKDAARRAAAFLTLPPHAGRGATLVYRSVDAMWRAAGDTATDFNFYTKRAILAGVYSSTLMRWFTDTSEDESETEAFLARRIADVMRFESFKAKLRQRWSPVAKGF
jgi:ubiquinone biosynthesis protein COQ9